MTLRRLLIILWIAWKVSGLYMFGFQKFTSTYSCRSVWLNMFLLLGIHCAVFSELVNGNAGIICVILLLLLPLALPVLYISDRVVVVYLDGELESVTKEKFLEAIKNQDISYIPSRDYDLDGLACMNFFLSTFEWELVDGEIERIMRKKYGSNL